MKRSFESISDQVLRVTAPEKATAFALGPSGNSLLSSRMSDIRDNNAWLVRDGAILPEAFTARFEHQGLYWAEGCHFDGVLLEQLLPDGPAEDDSFITSVLEVLKSMNRLVEASQDCPIFQENGIMTGPDGVLFLPPKLLQLYRETQSIEGKIRSFYRYYHPTLAGSRNFLFGVGVILYRAVTGRYPFEADEEYHMGTIIRDASLTPPRYLNPDITQESADFIMKLLGRKPGGSALLVPEKVEPEETISTLTQWISQGWKKICTDRERQALLARARGFEDRAMFTMRVKHFFQRNGKGLVAAAVIGVIGFYAISLMSSDSTVKPDTAAYSQEKAIRTFYDSITNLNVEGMESVAKKEVTKPLTDSINTIYVVSRTRQAQEGKSGIVNAQEWQASGRPRLDKTDYVYGIASLKLVKEDEDTFIAEYDFWKPVSGELPAAETDIFPVRYRGEHYKVRVDLVQEPTGWKIVSITPIATADIPL